VPEITVPHQFEQLLNSKRVAATGTGILLGDKRPYGRVTAEELQQALDEILQQPHYHQNAQRIGQTLQDAGGYLRAVAEIEAYIPEKLAQATT
jgi:UDP:flavonoid glycosyltransferase YjiC (YdhE family)